jgi:hypothetical protein
MAYSITAAPRVCALRQYLYFCTSKASKLGVPGAAEAAGAARRADVSQHTSAYIGICQHMSAYMSAYAAYLEPRKQLEHLVERRSYRRHVAQHVQYLCACVCVRACISIYIHI